MKQLSAAAVERAMKLQDVMLRAMAKRITWFQAAEILGISCRQMQRWKTRFKLEGYEGLFDRRRGIPSPKRVPLKTVEEVLRLYQEQYFDFNVRHFHEKLVEEHKIRLSTDKFHFMTYKCHLMTEPIRASSSLFYRSDILAE
jgi:transposase